ncbi:hypothetical protein Plhal304r1_c033g0104721 [Plasmopara halstedii]
MWQMAHWLSYRALGSKISHVRAVFELMHLSIRYLPIHLIVSSAPTKYLFIVYNFMIQKRLISMSMHSDLD